MVDIRYKSLIESILHGDEQAFEELFSIFHPKLYQFALSFSKSRELADEIVMDVFFNIWKRKRMLKAVSNIETYLYVSVRNVAFNSIKKESRFSFDLLDDVSVDLARYEKTPEGTMITSENIRAINQAVEMLPPKCKMIFKLIREDDLSRKEVAGILGISVKTIDNQIAIAVKKIAEVLEVDLSDKSKFINYELFLLSF